MLAPEPTSVEYTEAERQELKTQESELSRKNAQYKYDLQITDELAFLIKVRTETKTASNNKPQLFDRLIRDNDEYNRQQLYLLTVLDEMYTRFICGHGTEAQAINDLQGFNIVLDQKFEQKPNQATRSYSSYLYDYEDNYKARPKNELRFNEDGTITVILPSVYFEPKPHPDPELAALLDEPCWFRVTLTISQNLEDIKRLRETIAPRLSDSLNKVEQIRQQLNE